MRSSIMNMALYFADSLDKEKLWEIAVRSRSP